MFRTRIQSEPGGSQLHNICYMGLSLCRQQIHPSRASMNLEIPLDVKTVDEIKSDLMKVHVYESPANNVMSQKILPKTTVHRMSFHVFFSLVIFN